MSIEDNIQRRALTLVSVTILLFAFGCGGPEHLGIVESEEEASPSQRRAVALEDAVPQESTDMASSESFGPPVLLVSTAPCDETGSLTGACQPRDVGPFDLFSDRSSNVALFATQGAPPVEEVLEHGLRQAGASPVHLAIRGTVSPNSIPIRSTFWPSMQSIRCRGLETQSNEIG